MLTGRARGAAPGSGIVVTVATRLGHFAMLFGKGGSRCHVRVGSAAYFPTAYDVAVPAHHRLEANLRNVCRPRLPRIAPPRTEHVSRRHEVGN
jgi:hypothetical protein